MPMMDGLLRAKVAGSGMLLLVTAGYHATGYRGIAGQLAASGLPPELAAGLGGLWLFFSWHLAAVGLAALGAAVGGKAWLRPVILFCGLVALVDFLWVLSFAGWFPGTLLLLLAALGLLIGGSLWRGDAGPAGGDG